MHLARESNSLAAGPLNAPKLRPTVESKTLHAFLFRVFSCPIIYARLSPTICLLGLRWHSELVLRARTVRVPVK